MLLEFPLFKYPVFVGMLCLGLPAYALTPECKDISNNFSFYGEWLGMHPTDRDFPQAKRAPAISNYGFLYGLQQVIRPKYVQVSKGPADGDFIIEALEPAEVLPGARNLTFSINLKCTNGKWEKTIKSSGGGENVPSTRVAHVLLSISGEGDLIAHGSETTTTGLIFKRTSSWQWQAVFRKWR